MSRRSKSIETERSLEVAKEGLGERENEEWLSMIQMSFGGDGNALKLSVVLVAQFCEYVKNR